MENRQIPLSRVQLFWLNLAFWSGLCLLDIVHYYAYEAGAETENLLLKIVSYSVPYYLGFWILSFGIYRVFHRVKEWPWKKALVTLLGVSFLFGILNMLFSIPLRMLWRRAYAGSEYTFLEAFLINVSKMYPMAISGMLMFCVVLIILFAMNYYQKYRNQYTQTLELESKLTKAQLQTLKMQLQPHFLFNALNTISMMVRQQKGDKAVTMISGLSDLLRKTLNRQSVQLVPLEEEMDILRQYLEIEEVRFQDKLTVSLEIAENTREIKVPSLLLQPIVENAFKYGISRSLGDAFLGISSQINGNYLYLLVENTGPGLPPGWSLQSNQGIGLSSTISRLEQLFGDNFRFRIDNRAKGGVLVEIRIPVQ